MPLPHDSTFLERQLHTPLFDAVVNYAKEKKVSFHTPGHKHGDGIAKRFREFVGARIFDIDLTLLEEVDSLHDPQGVIREAQELAAETYGADATFFLVNGTSVGNHAMILAACEPGDKILIPRNAHQSVFAGIILSGAVPVYVQPVLDRDLHVVANVATETVAKALDEHPDLKAVLITSPTYHGITADLPAIARLVRSRGKLLLVDEAHGPHFRFHPDLPISAMEAGADICVQSMHKILGAMTQASLLHVKGRSISRSRVRKMLQLLQTTSPSYILMSSLDVARMQMATEGHDQLTRVIQAAEDARARIRQIPGLSCFGREAAGRSGVQDVDVTKVTVGTSAIGVFGTEVADVLNHEYGIQIEYADTHGFLAIVSIGNTKHDLDMLVSALKLIVQQQGQASLVPHKFYDVPTFSTEVPMTPRDAAFAKSEQVPFGESVGRICAEIVSPYPPGIPLLVPGERISRETYQYMSDLAQLGARINGQDDAKLKTIKVVHHGVKP